MEQHNPSNRPTVELNHEPITTLRSLSDNVEIDRELVPVHDQYLRGEYPTTEHGHALVDDLSLSASQLEYDGAIDGGHTADGFDVQAAKNDLCEDAISEIFELVCRQVKGARADALRGDRR